MADPQQARETLDRWLLHIDRLPQSIAAKIHRQMAGRRDEFILIVDELYDRFVKPMNLPGPDMVLDPIIRTAILAVAANGYDQFLNHLKEQGGS